MNFFGRGRDEEQHYNEIIPIVRIKIKCMCLVAIEKSSDFILFFNRSNLHTTNRDIEIVRRRKKNILTFNIE